ncbi:MAG: hypothetical protein AAF533_04540 [Acidobacteriota bacterium]
MKTVVLATCEEWPEPESDEPLREALSALGLEVVSAPWTSDFETFASADVVVMRACWDYYLSPDRFLRWLDRLEQASVRIMNPLATLRWNFDKRYLIELAERGVRTIPTEVIHADNESARAGMNARGWEVAVRKPIHGQSGQFVEQLALSRSDWPEPRFEGPALLQAFQSDISELGETLLVFFDGAFSHALRRELPSGEWRSNSKYGARRVRVEVGRPVIEQARNVLDIATTQTEVGVMPRYARIDGLVRDDTFTLMELELIEPALGFELAPEAAGSFAELIAGTLR